MNDRQRESRAKFNEFVQDYIDGYEFRGDGDYSPNEFERMLITDCVAGLIYELGVGPEIPRQAAGADPVESLRESALCDIYYSRGLQHGFGLGDRGDNEGLAKALKARQGAVSALKQSSPKPPKTAPHTDHPGPSTTACDDQEAPEK